MTNVHELKPRDPNAAPIRRKPYDQRKPYCRHEHVEVDERHRELTCSDCGSDVDPFAFLESLAHGIDRYTDAARSAKDDAKRAEATLADLKRQIRNARATLRRVESGRRP